MMSRNEDLLTEEVAAQRLGLDADGLAAAVRDGELRRVTYRGESFVLGADVARVARERDPRVMAQRVPRPGGGTLPSDDDPDGPRALAARVPRL